MNLKIVLCLFLCLLSAALESCINLEETPNPLVIETKQIFLDDYPNAFNPSIVWWNGRLLMSFRNIANPKDSYNTSEIGLVWLDDYFQPIQPPQLLKLNGGAKVRRAEDARLINAGGHLYVVYSDNEDLIISRGRFRVYVAELEENGGDFFILNKDRLEVFEKNNSLVREKNWTPFEYQGNLFLSYSLNPHLVFRPLLGKEECKTVAFSNRLLSWEWGTLRGGTQALLVENCYLTFFHSSLKMISQHSDDKEMPHYFMGACTFESEPPFEMIGISPEPIIGHGFFSGPTYKPYWGSWRGIFPGGFIYDDSFIWVVFGRQNHELWIVKLDKRALFQSLIPVNE